MRAYTVFITLALLALGTVVDARPGHIDQVPAVVPVVGSSSESPTPTTDTTRQTDPANRVGLPKAPKPPVPAGGQAETTTSSSTATATTTTATATATSTSSSSSDGAQPTPNAPQPPAPVNNLTGKASGQRSPGKIVDTVNEVKDGLGRREEEVPDEFKAFL